MFTYSDYTDLYSSRVHANNPTAAAGNDNDCSNDGSNDCSNDCSNDRNNLDNTPAHAVISPIGANYITPTSISWWVAARVGVLFGVMLVLMGVYEAIALYHESTRDFGIAADLRSVWSEMWAGYGEISKERSEHASRADQVHDPVDPNQSHLMFPPPEFTPETSATSATSATTATTAASAVTRLFAIGAVGAVAIRRRLESRVISHLAHKTAAISKEAAGICFVRAPSTWFGTAVTFAQSTISTSAATACITSAIQTITRREMANYVNQATIGMARTVARVSTIRDFIVGGTGIAGSASALIAYEGPCEHATPKTQKTQNTQNTQNTQKPKPHINQ